MSHETLNAGTIISPFARITTGNQAENLNVAVSTSNPHTHDFGTVCDLRGAGQSADYLQRRASDRSWKSNGRVAALRSGAIMSEPEIQIINGTLDLRIVPAGRVKKCS